MRASIVRGSWQGVPEFSYRIELMPQPQSNARAITTAVAMGIGLGQDAVVASFPIDSTLGGEAPAVRISKPDQSAVTEAEWEAITREFSASRSLDFTGSDEDNGFELIYFGDDAGLNEWRSKIESAIQAAGLAVEVSRKKVRSDLYEARDYRRVLQEMGDQDAAGRSSQLLQGVGADVLAPALGVYAKHGFTFNPRLYASTYGLDESGLAQFEQAIRQSGITVAEQPLESTNSRPRPPNWRVSRVFFAALAVLILEPYDYSIGCRRDTMCVPHLSHACQRHVEE